ncbi:MAG: TIGR01212 family radical SAM protein [Firmicutes bacterium]|nr:TIGR01212 family radical SAM protein [Bacillota bacterium]
MNYFKYTLDNKRYHTLNYEYKKIFNSKVFKVSLNGGFTCPNIDGKFGYGGCIYCSKNGSGEFAGDKEKDLITQFNEVKTVLEKKWPNSKYIAYFQANTNTYAQIDVLKEKYETVLKLDNVVGLSISTRPDSISDEVLDYLEELNTRTYLTVELGLQTIHEKTSKLINRCHTLECFDEMVRKLHKRKIRVVVHIINGLPYETKEMMLETVRHINKLPIDGVKIHMLHILKDTPLEMLYKKERFHVLTKEEYVNIVCDQLEILKDTIVINRITGDPKSEDLVEPNWLTKKFGVLNDIDKELERRNTYQGFKISVLNKVRQLADYVVKPNDIVIDATCGNGKDTLFLSKLVPNGHVFGFDIQDIAISNTKNLLDENNINNYTLFNFSHDLILEKLNDYQGKISFIVYNLGYLPNGNENITTHYESTISSIKQSLKLLNKKGMIVITVYPGHNEGKKESVKLKEFLNTIKDKYNIGEFHNTNKNDSPYVIYINNYRKIKNL